MSLTFTQEEEEFINNAIIAKDKKGYLRLADVFRELMESPDGVVDIGDGWSIFFDWNTYYTFRCLNKKLVSVYRNGVDICPISKCGWVSGKPGRCEHLMGYILPETAKPDASASSPNASLRRLFKNNAYSIEGELTHN